MSHDDVVGVSYLFGLIKGNEKGQKWRPPSLLTSFHYQASAAKEKAERAEKAEEAKRAERRKRRKGRKA